MSYEEKPTKKHNENFANPIEYPSHFPKQSPPNNNKKSPTFASNNPQSFGRNANDLSPNAKSEFKFSLNTKSPDPTAQANRQKQKTNNADQIPAALNQSTDELDRSPYNNDEDIPSYYKNTSNTRNNNNMLDRLNNSRDEENNIKFQKGRAAAGKTTVDSKTKALLQEARQPLAVSDSQAPQREQQIDKLVMQNLNLREQLREMATLLDDIIEKEKEQKVMKYSSNSRPFESEQIKQRRKELQKQTDLISSNRILIQQKKRQLEYNFDINRITEKENEVQRLRKELEAVNNEKSGLKKIADSQKQAKADVERQEFKDQLDLIKKQFNEAKDENQRLAEELRGKEKELKGYIEELKTRTEKIRTINSKVKEQQIKKKPNATKPPNLVEGEEVNEENLQIIEERVVVLEKEKQEIERQFIEKMKNLERERKQQQAEIERKQLVLKEREKTLKLTQMKIKEITRFIKTTASENEKKQQMAALLAKQEQQAFQQQQQQQLLLQQQQQYPMQEDMVQRQAVYQKGGRGNLGALSRLSQNR